MAQASAAARHRFSNTFTCIITIILISFSAPFADHLKTKDKTQILKERPHFALFYSLNNITHDLSGSALHDAKVRIE